MADTHSPREGNNVTTPFSGVGQAYSHAELLDYMQKNVDPIFSPLLQVGSLAFCFAVPA
jgi:hypothetical protein